MSLDQEEDVWVKIQMDHLFYHREECAVWREMFEEREAWCLRMEGNHAQETRDALI